LDGDFQEAENQAIDLPEEDPSIFSFVVAYLYEEKFIPIKPISTVLLAEPEKGKGKTKEEEEANSDSADGSDTAGSASDERYDIPINSKLVWQIHWRIAISFTRSSAITQAPEWAIEDEHS
jgi:hypothetical protein